MIEKDQDLEPDVVPPALAYTGLTVDRAGNRRTDLDWVAVTAKHPDSMLIPLWRDRCLVAGARPDPITIPMTAAERVLAAAAEPVFLGLDGDAGLFAADLSALPEADALRLTDADEAVDVRRLVAAFTPAEAGILAYARGLLHWHRNQRFCGACGAATMHQHGGHLRVCAGEQCGRLLFPRIEPAVIVLVEAPTAAGVPDRCLLARHRGAGADGYSTLAGFVEIGESLEDAVRRELAEEAGVVVDAVRYQASQAWPFPAGLMVGFRARAMSDAIAADRNELEEARWFTRPELADLLVRQRRRKPQAMEDSIEAHLLESWLYSVG